jgi:hypothetical protein
VEEQYCFVYCERNQQHPPFLSVFLFSCLVKVTVVGKKLRVIKPKTSLHFLILVLAGSCFGNVEEGLLHVGGVFG